jgi:hypothetical protein
VAQDWQQRLDDGADRSRADLARQLGVSRARVTQMLDLLTLAPAVVHAVAALGDPLPQPIVTERLLRPLRKLTPQDQQRRLAGMLTLPQDGGTLAGATHRHS